MSTATRPKLQSLAHPPATHCIRASSAQPSVLGACHANSMPRVRHSSLLSPTLASAAPVLCNSLQFATSMKPVLSHGEHRIWSDFRRHHSKAADDTRSLHRNLKHTTQRQWGATIDWSTTKAKMPALRALWIDGTQ